MQEYRLKDEDTGECFSSTTDYKLICITYNNLEVFRNLTIQTRRDPGEEWHAMAA